MWKCSNTQSTGGCLEPHLQGQQFGKSLTEIWHINCFDYFEKPLFTLSLFSLSTVSFPSITNGSRSFNRDYLVISGSKVNIWLSLGSLYYQSKQINRWAANISLGQRHLYQAKNELQSSNSKTGKILSNRSLNCTIPGPQKKNHFQKTPLEFNLGSKLASHLRRVNIAAAGRPLSRT